MPINLHRTMTATVLAVDDDNSPIIEVGDQLKVRTSNKLRPNELKSGEWVIVRNPEVRGGIYLVRQYWPVDDGAMLVAGNPSIPAHRVTAMDTIDGVVLEIQSSRESSSRVN